MIFHLRSRINKALNFERSLAITTRIGCINNCSYCPQPVFIGAYRKRSSELMLSLDTFIRSIDKVPSQIIISFAGFCEPWMNPECTSMLLYAHQKGHKIRVNTSCIGMTLQDLERLKNLPFKKFVIHIPDNQGLSKIKVDSAYLEIISTLANTPVKNLVWKFHRTERNEEGHPLVLEILEKAQAEIRFFGLSNRAGSVRIDDRPEVAYKSENLYPCKDFHHNILFPNGDVGLCHMDWGLKHIIGNLLITDYKTLFKGEEFQRIQRALLDEKEALQCRLCEKSRVKKPESRLILPAFLRFGKHTDNLYDE